jgi:SAM-dependent methyltransferase
MAKGKVGDHVLSNDDITLGGSSLTDSIAETYNKLAHDYEHSVDINNAYNTDYERPAMIQLLPRNMSGINILDAGCAAGWYSQQFINFGANVTAIDISSEMVAATKRRVGDSANIICHDLKKSLPFDNESFHIIVSSLTLHYIEDWEATFCEFHRVLKPSGCLLFSVHHPFMDFTRFEIGDYFADQLLRDHWTTGTEDVEVTFYRRPVQTIINQMTRYFHIDKLVEPQPTPEFEKKRPKSYQTLMKNPYFLIVKAYKQSCLG